MNIDLYKTNGTSPPRSDDTNHVRRQRTCKRLLSYIYLSPKARTRKEIFNNVFGRTQDISILLQNLCSNGELVREGTGVKGDPFKYKMPIVEPVESVFMEDDEVLI